MTRCMFQATGLNVFSTADWPFIRDARQTDLTTSYCIS